MKPKTPNDYNQLYGETDLIKAEQHGIASAQGLNHCKTCNSMTNHGCQRCAILNGREQGKASMKAVVEKVLTREKLDLAVCEDRRICEICKRDGQIFRFNTKICIYCYMKQAISQLDSPPVKSMRKDVRKKQTPHLEVESANKYPGRVDNAPSPPTGKLKQDDASWVPSSKSVDNAQKGCGVYIERAGDLADGIRAIRAVAGSEKDWEDYCKSKQTKDNAQKGCNRIIYGQSDLDTYKCGNNNRFGVIALCPSCQKQEKKCS